MKIWLLTFISFTFILPQAFAKKSFADIKFEKFTATPLAISPALEVKDFKGKVVLMDFWASWCEPCKEALPHYNALYKKYQDKGLLIVGINEDDASSDREHFLKKNSVNFPIYADTDRQMAKVFDVAALPSLFIFNKEGKIVALLRGFSGDSSSTLEKKITELLK